MMELICVIMIIGSLAAVAFPQFMNVSKEARVARVQRLRADIQMVAASTRAECILINGCIGRRGTYTVLGKTIPLDYGYPRAGNSIGSDQIDALVDTNQFEVTLDNIDVTRFRLSTASNPATCYVLYREADGPSMKREYGLSINTTGC